MTYKLRCDQQVDKNLTDNISGEPIGHQFLKMFLEKIDIWIKTLYLSYQLSVCVFFCVNNFTNNGELNEKYVTKTSAICVNFVGNNKNTCYCLF